MTIDPGSMTQNPFAVITIIAAPAILTNAASILTLSTSTRLIRVADRIRELSERLDEPGLTQAQKDSFLLQVSRSQKQSTQFLSALRAIYLSLACFAFASFLAILGASTARLLGTLWVETLATLSLAIGGVGVLGFIWAAVNLIRASHITVLIINDDIDHLKRNHTLVP